MQALRFHKYQGTGNDFIMIDNLMGDFSLSNEQIIRLCDRKFGIGSDGIILIEQSNDADFYMNFYNPDGSKSFCGNGSRCAVRFAQALNIARKSGNFVAIDGHHSFESSEEIIQIHMKDVKSFSKEGSDFIIHTGSPHYIISSKNIEHLDVLVEGRKIRYSEPFKEKGINVNFVEFKDNSLHIRTYERGVENETLSCGTGVTAAALSYGILNPEINKLNVTAIGGNLTVQWSNNGDGSFSDIKLSGPAVFIYQGIIQI